ncbi:hypothetical protein [Amycolatopsis taiwanensis]|uniref:hypothetical protein n=1 Tax=Amycolatopsis taiwanensis TaxID=342230 RepID=UPI0012EB6EB8|nr:hypothetical protein [Amycolatopsis taiwanensis]
MNNSRDQNISPNPAADPTRQWHDEPGETESWFNAYCIVTHLPPQDLRLVETLVADGEHSVGEEVAETMKKCNTWARALGHIPPIVVSGEHWVFAPGARELFRRAIAERNRQRAKRAE